MVQCLQPCFDAAFAALSDVIRRGVLEQLARSDASITDLAERFDMTLTGMRKHVDVLVRAGLDAAIGSGSPGASPEQFAELDAVLAQLSHH